MVARPSIPLHLGAMPASVAAVIACDPGPDDVFILNDPYAGPGHACPDITLVSRTRARLRLRGHITRTWAAPCPATCPPTRGRSRTRAS